MAQRTRSIEHRQRWPIGVTRVRRILRLFARAFLLRCPNCGGGPIFKSWFHLREHCPKCGLALERHESEDYFLGGMMLNIIVVELVFVGGLILWGVLAWPNPPWDLFEDAGVPFMILAPLLFYPLSKTLWLAFDLCFRPVRPEELHTSDAPTARLPDA